MYECTRLGTVSWNRALCRTFLFLSVISVCCGVLVNRTIDDTFGDLVTGFVPIYQPSSFWIHNCDRNCTITPDAAQAFNGTWHWIIYEPSTMPLDVNITLRFTGVAIWIFFIVASGSYTSSNGSVANFDTEVGITLDGEFVSSSSYGLGLTYNKNIYAGTGLKNTFHELVISGPGDGNSPDGIYLNFDWAIYTADINTSTSPSTSRIGVIVGSTLGGLAAITLVLFLVRRLRPAPPVRNGMAEGMLDIDVPPLPQPFYEHEIPVPDRDPTQSKAARLREARQRELEEHIQSAQHELDNLRSLRNARSAVEICDPSATGPSRPGPELALLHNEMQQLRDRVDYLQAQRESDWAPGLSNEPLPPTYTQLSYNVQ